MASSADWSVARTVAVEAAAQRLRSFRSPGGQGNTDNEGDWSDLTERGIAQVALSAACDPALGSDGLVPRRDLDEWIAHCATACEAKDEALSEVGQLRETLEGLAQAARWFSSEADYTVPEVIESEFIEALETAEDLLRGRS